MNNKIELKFIEQRWEGIEGWIGNNDDFWVRLDFFLEYFVSKNLKLSYKYKNKEINQKKYCELLFEKIKENTSKTTKFNYKNYKKWLSMENPEINKVIELMNK
tara:strand:- start:31377 stop:31685 length:309 start_codon:yes stop_codon:yes gene_type:complete